MRQRCSNRRDPTVLYTAGMRCRAFSMRCAWWTSWTRAMRLICPWWSAPTWEWRWPSCTAGLWRTTASVCSWMQTPWWENTEQIFFSSTLWKVRILLTEWMLITFIWKCPGSIKHRWALWEGGAVCSTRPGLARLLQLGGFCLQTI